MPPHSRNKGRNDFTRRSLGWQDEMARRYGVRRDTIKQVVRGEIWAA